MPEDRKTLKAQDIKDLLEEEATKLLDTVNVTNTDLYRSAESFILLARALLNTVLDEKRFYDDSDQTFINYSLIAEALPKMADLVKNPYVDTELVQEIVSAIDRLLKSTKSKVYAAVMRTKSPVAKTITQASPTLRSNPEQGALPKEDEDTISSRAPEEKRKKAQEIPPVAKPPVSAREAILRARERRYIR